MSGLIIQIVFLFKFKVNWMHPRIFRLFFITILLVSGCIFPYSLVYKQKLLHVSVKTPLLMQCCPEALVNGLSRLLVDTEAAVTHRKYFLSGTIISFDANSSSFSLVESPPCDQQITVYKIMVCSRTISSNCVWLQINNILLMRKWNHTFHLLAIAIVWK